MNSNRSSARTNSSAFSARGEEARLRTNTPRAPLQKRFISDGVRLGVHAPLARDAHGRGALAQRAPAPDARAPRVACALRRPPPCEPRG